MSHVAQLLPQASAPASDQSMDLGSLQFLLPAAEQRMEILRQRLTAKNVEVAVDGPVLTFSFRGRDGALVTVKTLVTEMSEVSPMLSAKR